MMSFHSPPTESCNPKQGRLISKALKMNEIRRFKDPIHDYMSFGPLVCSIIDTNQFQRLRNIKQLGTSYYVWSGASHNRFEHCLGVAYLAMKMVEHLQISQPDLKITDREIDCVTIAGLCHDLGHGPWSHVWDSLFIPKALPDKKWKHEDASQMMFDDLVRENNIELDEADVLLVKALIVGEPDHCGADAKRFLFEIVANKRNGLDVDKFDYIARDTHAVNQHTMSLTRLIHSARVIGDQICYDIKDANQIYELYYTRFSLHKLIYNHKTAKAIEYMIIDALLAAEPYMKLAEQIEDPKRFVHLTDEIKGRIETTTDLELDEARKIFDRINTRNLYRLVDYKVFTWGFKEICHSTFTPERIVEAAKRSSMASEHDVNVDVVEALDPKHVIVDLSPMHYGMQDKNPLDFMWFYSKHNPDVCQKAGPGDISLLMPQEFGEVLLRIYTRENCFFGLIQAGYRKVLEQLNNRLNGTSANADENLELATPLPLQPPATAGVHKPLSRRTSGAVFGGGLNDEGLGTTPLLSNNVFTSVPPGYQPSSPCARGTKRDRVDGSDSPVRRRRVS